ncbi:MAG: hypothetical protein R3B93_21550 [Bacteroidia bacterium]
MSLHDQPRLYSVSGLIKNEVTGKPIKGLTIRAFDKDFLSEQFLGEAITNGAGVYKIEFSQDDFQTIFKLERHPDVYIMVYNQKEELIYTSNFCVNLNAGLNTVIDANLPIESVEEKDITYLFGERVNVQKVARLSTKDLVNAYRLIRRPELEVENKKAILEAFPDLAVAPRKDKECGEGSGDGIRWFLRERRAIHLIGDFDDFTIGVVVKEFFTANVVVRYTLDSTSDDVLTGGFEAIPPPGTNDDYPLPGAALADPPFGIIRGDLINLHTDNTEVAPTYVQKVGLIAEYALTHFINPRFSYLDPRNGASRLEIRLLAQGTGIAGSTDPTWSHVEIDINNTDEQNAFTVPHEIFHQVQYRYNDTSTRSGIYGILREGGARFNAESLIDVPNRYVDSAIATLLFPADSLLNPGGGASNPIRYAAGLFWKYIAEQHSPFTTPADEPAIGVETYRFLLEETSSAKAGYTMGGLKAARSKMPWYGSFDSFHYHDNVGKTELASHENTWSNYLIANYMHGLMQPGDSDFDSRFDYLEDEDPVTWSTSVVAQLADLQARVEVSNQLTIGLNQTFSRNVFNHKAYAAVYYEITPNALSVPRNLRIDFSASGGMTDPIIQILLLESGDTLKDIHKSDLATYSKTINMSGITKVVVIVASRENDGDFSLDFTEVANDSDVMVTRWDSEAGTEYQINPRGWAWTWVSPDIMVDNDNNMLADSEVYFDQNNKLKVRLRNKGNMLADDIQIEFWYQKAAPFLTLAGWIPVENASGTTQIITGELLNPGQEKWFTVDWAPANDGTNHNHWCVKVRVTSAGDSNIDNKLAMSNFSNVIVAPSSGRDYTLVLKHPYIHKYDRVIFVPRGPKFNFELLNPEILIRRENPAPICYCKPAAKLPEGIKFGTFKVVSNEQREKWDEKLTSFPSENRFYYPVNKKALPPGVDPSQLVTAAYIVDGEVVGGITYSVEG